MAGGEDAGRVERAFRKPFSSAIHNDSSSEAYNNLALVRSEDTRVDDVADAGGRQICDDGNAS